MHLARCWWGVCRSSSCKVSQRLLVKTTSEWTKITSVSFGPTYGPSVLLSLNPQQHTLTARLNVSPSLTQSRCAALERLCSEITSLPQPAAAPSSRASSEQRAASTPSPVLAPDTATPTVADPTLAVVSEVASKEDGEADPEKAVAVAGEDGTPAEVAVADGVVATDVEVAAVAPALKSKWVPAPFGGTITTADLQRQVCACGRGCDLRVI